MKRKTVWAFLVLTLTMSSCISGNLSKLNSDAMKSYEEKRFDAAFEKFQEVITAYESKGKSAPGETYTLAGLILLEKNEFSQAQVFLEKARQNKYINGSLFYGLSQVYRKIDNLSKEITALELFMENCPDASDNVLVKIRLFEVYIESENYDKALEIWSTLDESKNDSAKLLASFALLNFKLDKQDIAVETAKRVLSMQKDNFEANEILGLHYYNKAEALYQKEMKAYQKNRTHKQYAQLLNALKLVTEEFKIARDCIEIVYKQKQESSYAQILANIYTRLDNQTKANYYKTKI